MKLIYTPNDLKTVYPQAGDLIEVLITGYAPLHYRLLGERKSLKGEFWVWQVERLSSEPNWNERRFLAWGEEVQMLAGGKEVHEPDPEKTPVLKSRMELLMEQVL